MSQYYGACHGTALVFSETELFQQFLPRYKDIHIHTEEETEDFENFLESEDFQEYVFAGDQNTTFQICPLQTDDCDGALFIPMSSWSKTEDVAIDRRHENLYVIWAEKPTSLKAWLSGESYPSKETLLDEYRTKVSAYVPTNFTWEDHIGELSCAIYA